MTTADALRAARSASQQVRDDALRAEVVLLRDENRRLQLKFDAASLSFDNAIRHLERANDALEHQQADLETCRVQRDAASAVADLLLPRTAILGPDHCDECATLSATAEHYWAVTAPEESGE